jgi:hypothetical protein
MKAKPKKWIQKANIKEGGLHAALHIPEGKKIPHAKKVAAAKKGGKLGKMGRLALTFEKISHKRSTKKK